MPNRITIANAKKVRNVDLFFGGFFERYKFKKSIVSDGNPISDEGKRENYIPGKI